MSDPRDVLDYTGINPELVTYMVDTSAIPYDPTHPQGTEHAGKAVRIFADNTIGLTASQTPVLGKLILVERDGKATVQTGGYCTLPRYAAGDAKTIPNAKIVGGDTLGTVVGVAPATLAEVAVAAHMVVRREGSADVTVRLG